VKRPVSSSYIPLQLGASFLLLVSKGNPHRRGDRHRPGSNRRNVRISRVFRRYRNFSDTAAKAAIFLLPSKVDIDDVTSNSSTVLERPPPQAPASLALAFACVASPTVCCCCWIERRRLRPRVDATQSRDVVRANYEFRRADDACRSIVLALDEPEREKEGRIHTLVQFCLIILQFVEV